MEISSNSRVHVVESVLCHEISLEVSNVGYITILEATAESQDVLVNMALELYSDDFHGPEGGTQNRQLLSSGDPYGAVLWPAAWSIATYLLDHNLVKGKTILELGAGTGLVSMAASRGGAKRVVATDYEPIPLKLLEYADENLNRRGDSVRIETELLDMANFNFPLPEADVVVAADVMYEPATGRAVAHRVVEALRRGNRVIVGDSPGRPGRVTFLDTLKDLGVQQAEFFEAKGRTVSGPRNELICGKTSKSVSSVPQDLEVAILDLAPGQLKKGTPTRVASGTPIRP